MTISINNSKHTIFTFLLVILAVIGVTIYAMNQDWLKMLATVGLILLLLPICFHSRYETLHETKINILQKIGIGVIYMSLSYDLFVSMA